jgi:hypothetical protein
MKQKSILWVISLLITGLLGLFIGSSTQKLADQPVAATLLDENILKNQPDLLQRDNVNDSNVITKAEKEAIPTKDLSLSEHKKTIKDVFEVVVVSDFGDLSSLSTQHLQPRCDDDSLLVGGGYYSRLKSVHIADNTPSIYSKINPSERTDNSWTVNYWTDVIKPKDYPGVEAHALCLKLK